MQIVTDFSGECPNFPLPPPSARAGNRRSFAFYIVIRYIKGEPAPRAGPARNGLQPKLIYQVQPLYPPLARQARVQGDVVLDSVIDQQGHVTQLKVVPGHPLLVESAIHAVAQWRYQPTLLNGTPVAVDMMVTVHFDLGQPS